MGIRKYSGERGFCRAIVVARKEKHVIWLNSIKGELFFRFLSEWAYFHARRKKKET